MEDTGRNQDTAPPEAPVQLREVFPVRVHANRYPMRAPTNVVPVAELSERQTPTGDTSYQVELRAQVSFKEAEPAPFDLDVAIVGLFEQVGALPEGETLDSYVRKTAFFLLLPFLRGEVYDLSVRLRLQPPLMLPLVVPRVALGPPTDAPTQGRPAPGGSRPRRSSPPRRPTAPPPTSSPHQEGR